MKLTEIISEDLKSALKAKDKVRLEACRAAKTAFTLAISAKGAGSTLTEEEELKIMNKLVKQRRDSAEIYKNENRMDLYERETQEADILEKYLPEQLSGDELEALLKDIIRRTGAENMKDMGKVMGAAIKELAGKADGKVIAGMVKKLLS